MAKDKGWAPVTTDHRWYIFARMLAVLGTQHDGTRNERPVIRNSNARSTATEVSAELRSDTSVEIGFLSEDDVKRALCAYLAKDGWECEVKWGYERGIDIEAKKDHRRWVIEAKGQGSLEQQLQAFSRRMLSKDIPVARYVKAFGDWSDALSSIIDLPSAARNWWLSTSSPIW